MAIAAGATATQGYDQRDEPQEAGVHVQRPSGTAMPVCN